jgi:heterodisulfide reductase subunit B
MNMRPRCWPSRNLAIAEKAGPADLLTPCSACYLVLNKAKHNIKDFPDVRDSVHARFWQAG